VAREQDALRLHLQEFNDVEIIIQKRHCYSPSKGLKQGPGP
jgi:hypothetical protein